MDMYIGIVTKMIVGSMGIFVVLRLLGKKAMSELTPFDLLYVLILGSLVEESIYDDNVNVFHIIFALVLWGITVYIVEELLENTEKISTLIEGEPSVLIAEGRLNIKELKDNHFDMEQLRTMLRQSDCYSISDAYYAILEVNGELTVITKDQAEILTYLLIEEGVIKEKTLKGIHKDEEWLRSSLSELGYPSIEEILYCEWDEKEDKFVVGTYEDTINKKIYIED